ncbi:MAG: ABC transporter substrate-binding protein [Planctomycetota bacterium]
MTRRPPVSLTVATGNYDRIRPLADGRVLVRGCRLRYVSPPLDALFIRAFRDAEFDVAELSLSYYLIAMARGGLPYVAIPVFVSRSFRHSTIYIRTDRGICRPEDLAGKRVGVREYQTTFAVLMRGLLHDSHGLDPADVEWHIGPSEAGPESPMYHPPMSSDLERHVVLHAIAPGKTLAAMLANGEIDAVMSNRPPACFVAGHPFVGRLFKDWAAAERAYFAATGVFPIMHVIGVRRQLIDDYPWLPMRLFQAFNRAKSIAAAELDQTQALAVMLPWLAETVAETKALMRDNYWPYGITQNRTALETSIRHTVEQGLCSHPLTLAQLFDASTLAT